MNNKNTAIVLKTIIFTGALICTSLVALIFVSQTSANEDWEARFKAESTKLYAINQRCQEQQQTTIKTRQSLAKAKAEKALKNGNMAEVMRLARLINELGTELNSFPQGLESLPQQNSGAGDI